MAENQLPVRQPSKLPLPALPIRTIVVATDFSDHATAVEAIAAGLARQSMARLILVHTIVQSEYSRALGQDAPLQEKLIHESREAALKQLRQRCESLRESGTEVEHIVAAHGHASASEGIIEVARRQKADLIVIGTHGRTGLKYLLLGSVAAAVVRSAPCSVLTVHAPRWPYAQGPILVPTDFSANAAEALRFAGEVAWLKHLKTELVHVFDNAAPGSSLPFFGNEELEKWCNEARSFAQAKLTETAAAVCREGVPVEARLLEGPVARTIAEEAEKTHASLIVLASNSAAEWRKSVLGSTAEQIVRLANCPVLVVRGPEPQAD